MTNFEEHDSARFAADAAELAERSSTLLTAAVRRREAQAAAQEQASRVSHRATSPDGSVTVAVDQAGMPIELTLADSVQRVQPTRLARTILDTIREAADGARREVRGIYEPLAAEGLLRDPLILPGVPAEAGPVQPVRRRPVASDDDEGPRESWMAPRRNR